MTDKEKATRDAVMKFGTWLMDSGIKSFGPQTGMVLLEIRKDLTAKMKSIKDPIVRIQAQRYADALEEVTVASAIHQKFVLDTFSALLGAKGLVDGDDTKAS